MEDPILPHLWSIKAALDNKEDIHFSGDHKGVFREIQELNICLDKSLLYESYALYLEENGAMKEAHRVYQLGISRNANPIGRLKKAHTYFLERVCLILDAPSSQNKTEGESNSNCVNPWSISVVKQILQKMNAQISEYQGYHASSKCYSGAVALSSLQKSARNKVIEMDGDTYQITGCAGKGGFAQVYKACVNSKKDEVVALKIQKPPFPWEFYMYRQLDLRIPENERSCFGYAHRLHLYSDYSIIVTKFLAHKTLLDAINSNGVTHGSMDEVLCIYYTIEMLSMLETLHRYGIIHGDFKPDNLLIRQARDDLTEDDFRTRSGSWRQQVDTYGLCGIVHVMLHNDWMEIEKKTSFDGGYSFQPKLPFKRYQKVELWKKLFGDLLNNDIYEEDEHLKMLGNLSVLMHFHLEFQSSEENLFQLLA
ncbi:mitotic checkpoint serine/threonine-protein kinase BUB1 [Tanacetum coccineum]